MECYTCDLTSICKIYEFVSLQKAHANISVNDCRVKRTDSAAPEPENNPVTTNCPPDIRSTDSISSISDRIRELSKPVEVSQEAFSECPECKQGSSPSDICECEGCKKSLCIGCAVEDSSTQKHYCEDCWDNL